MTSEAWWKPENIGKYKLVKARITAKVANFSIGNITYVPGDIVEVPEEQVSLDFMQRIAEAPVETPKTEVVMAEPLHTGGPKLEDLPPQDDKSKAKRVLKPNVV
jgi:hypothetical protein